MTIRIFAAAAMLALGGTAYSGMPARAETPAQLDLLARASAQPGSGIALARQQIRSGALLDALATLERVILNHPENDDARLLHAGILCRIDDPDGARLELEDLRGRDFTNAAWDDATSTCSRRKEG